MVSEAALVVLGAGLGYGGARYQEWLRTKRAKRTLATAIMSELRWLEGILRQIYDHGPASYYDPLEHPMIQAALPHLILFEPTSAERLSHFHNLLRDTRALMDRYRQAPEQVRQRYPDFVTFTKAKAFYAASAIGQLAEAMALEGGTWPPPMKEESITASTLPPLPPRTFEPFCDENADADA